MKTLKINFTIPEEVAATLRARVGERKRSAFVAAAIQEKLDQLEEEQLRQALEEGYRVRRDEDAEVNREWEGATLESWR